MKQLILFTCLILAGVQFNFAQVISRNVKLMNQTEIDAFSGTEILGDLNIYGGTNLDKLDQLEKVSGRIMIQTSSLTSIKGLKNLKEVGGNFNIWYTKIPTLEGLDNLEKVGSLNIQRNNQLTSIDRLTSFKEGNLNINHNDNLLTVNINSVTIYKNEITISNNDKLQSIQLENLAETKKLEIRTNNNLTDVLIPKLQKVEGTFTLSYNSKLSECCTFNPLLTSGSIGTEYIYNNADGCSDDDEITTKCGDKLVARGIENIAMTPWEIHKGIGDQVIDFKTRTPGRPIHLPYHEANIPRNDHEGWQRASHNQGKIYYSAVSKIPNPGGNHVDFTYFQTHVWIPEDFELNSFEVSIDRADDGARIFLKNSKHFNDNHFDANHDLTFKDHPPQTIELKDEIVKGQDNRIIIVHFDDNPGANRVNGIHVKVNGEEVPLHSSNNTALHFKGDAQNDIEIEGNPLFFEESFTIETWIKLDGEKSGADAIFNIYEENKTAIYAEVGRNNNNIKGNVRFLLRNGPNNVGGIAVISTEKILDEKWHHIAAVKGDDDKLHLYIDGEYNNSSQRTITDFKTYQGKTNLKMRLGKNVDSNARPFRGAMDEVRCWNYARSADQIKNWLHKPLEGTEDGLVLYYDFNEGIAEGDNTSIKKVQNKVSNQYHGTLKGFSLDTHESNFVHSLPIYFK